MAKAPLFFFLNRKKAANGMKKRNQKTFFFFLFEFESKKAIVGPNRTRFRLVYVIWLGGLMYTLANICCISHRQKRRDQKENNKRDPNHSYYVHLFCSPTKWANRDKTQKITKQSDRHSIDMDTKMLERMRTAKTHSKTKKEMPRKK